MSSFDTILFGNGLTISILNHIRNYCSNILDERCLSLCSQNKYIAYLLSCPIYCSAYNDLLKICTYDSLANEIPSIIDSHKRAKEGFKQIDDLSGKVHIDYIEENGFEAWGGLHCFDDELSFYKKNKELVYSINNYWFHLLRNYVLSEPCSKAIIKDVATIISRFHNRLTLNFDTIVDEFCPVEHLHGSFVNEFKRWGDLLFFDYGNNTFEYPYLFGTNALEKEWRINRIKEIEKKQGYYNLSFFFDETRFFGDMLIYGISFSDSQTGSNTTNLKAHLIDSLLYHNCLDGHVLNRISTLQKSGRIKRIVIASYKVDEVVHYQRLIKDFCLNADIIVGYPLGNVKKKE